ncbi:NAD(P)-dependent oxidoreductase [Candidatus Tokpelaia sp.]|uniref:NAD(P)-dependent oxidoreductase n=1 Tax=Candidatus Tokpelaia sp. TaxID=2233777 RepID=UPI0012389582|nr:NAD(P)-dependent oxidoreductase [Candidatus Tokpelaia sp.]KAA6405256.1 oxidoreductase [Candidatus Tokpelaia sp.]
MAKLAFLGLGTMGFPMAGHLAAAGHDVTVYNRTAAKAENWLQHSRAGAKGALQSAASPAQAAEGQDFVFSCVSTDDDVRAVALGRHGAFQAMKPGAIYVDHSTVSADIARELGEKADKAGLGFIDAPVSGGQKGAVDGQLTIMCGGSPALFAKAAKIMQAYAVSVRLLGANGAGQICKMINQICLAGVVQGLAEGLAFGTKAGLDMAAVLEVIGKGSAASWQMHNSGSAMLAGAFDFGFAVDLLRKDLGLCLAEAKKNSASLPVSALIDQFYADLQRHGYGRNDVTALIRRLL